MFHLRTVSFDTQCVEAELLVEIKEGDAPFNSCTDQFRSFGNEREYII